ncbi:hypothetical protein ACF3M1_15940 [Luteimonas sp. WGS1318]|uniref:hypothetical protein n=1 Tax=Luteimonas sp. WGS1318 TaxID=3366815 RepID=UPI00372D359F
MLTLIMLHRRLRTIAVLAILISVATWALDLTGVVYACPFCRAQRSVIGLLGLLMLWPDPRGWAIRWLASVLGVFGAVVAATQHFAGWRRIGAGTFRFADPWPVDPFLLSGAALFAIVGLVLLLWSWQPAPRDAR